MAQYFNTHPVEYKGVVFGLEKLTAIWPEFLSLAEQEWGEVGDTDRYGMLRPDLDRARMYEQSGSLLIFTVRDLHTSALLGYYLATVSTSLKRAKERTLTEVAVYMHPEHRGGYTIRKLMGYVEMVGRRMGIAEIIMSHRPEAPRVGKLYARMGYTPICVSYRKTLKNKAEASDVA